MKSSIKHLLLSLTFIFVTSHLSFSQTEKASNPTTKTIPNSFILHGSLTDTMLAFYTKSIEAADFEQYRLRDANIELIFKNGFKLELISAKDLTIKNKLQNVNPNAYQEKKAVPAGYVYPVFEITDSGWILAAYQAKEVKVKKQ